ncbi:MAG: energy transducer TonB [Candidatus Sulfotelmatobacter sp.]
MNARGVVADETDQKQIEQRLEAVATRLVVPAARLETLFEDSLLEASSGHRKQRTWATLMACVLQCLLVGVLILVPLWFTDVLPKQQLLTFLEAPPPPPPPPPAAAPTPKAVRVVKVASDIAKGQLRTPGRIPAKVQMIKEDDAPPPTISEGVVGGVPGGVPGGQLGGVIGGIISSSSSLAAVPTLSKPTAMQQRVRVSQGVSKGLIVYRIEPPYPVLARQAHVQGTVVLTAFIDKEGMIQNLQLVSGHPLLAPAAIEAVKHWRYKPFLLNGQPVGVETTVTINFSLREA